MGFGNPFHTAPAVQESNPVFHQTFDHSKADWNRAKSDLEQLGRLQLSRLMTIFQPAYAEGIKGKALDLSSKAPVRSPIVMEKNDQIAYSPKQSFALVVWVKTRPGARQGTPIWTNKQHNTPDSVGWTLGTQDNGAWLWNMSDGKVSYNYKPTAEKQAINDGKWHQLAISVDRTRKEVWMYLDGRNVAIYQIENDNLQSLESKYRTILGGSDEKFDFESNGEWTAFNGYLDEAALYDRPLTVAEVRKNYEQLSGHTLPEIRLTPDRLKIQVWNIWHGGHRFGENVGVERTIEILKENNADIIGLIETYGSGAIIADSLGYYFYLISTNLSIMSRYPIEETISLYKPFNSGGAIINLGKDKRIAFFDMWLSWRGETERLVDINQILPPLEQYIKDSDRLPLIVVGDFNTTTHQDLTEDTQSLYKSVRQDRPVSELITKAGLMDSYRVVHPNPAMSPGYTWSPITNEIAALKKGFRSSRIDYIYYKSNRLLPYHSYVVDTHPVFYPSDHASVVTFFYLNWD